MKYIFSIVILIITLPDHSHAQAEPPRGMGELEAYSVFLDAYRSGDYELALNFGEWMLEARPREISGHDGFSLERQFDRMIEVYVNLAEGVNDPSQKTAYLENAEQVFDLVFDTFEEEEIDVYEWHLKQGRFYHENHEQMKATIDDAFENYEILYEIDSQRFAEESDGFFAIVLLTEYANSGESDKALEMIDEIEDNASSELLNTINDVRESLFANPEERIEFIEGRLAEAEGAEREEMLQSLVDLYNNVNDSEKAFETAMELYRINPDFENTRRVADRHLSDGNYSEAVDFLTEAMEIAETESDRKEIALEIAESYQQTGQFREARDYAQQALQIDGNYGEAYLAMASIYTRTISDCTGGEALDRDDRTVYWLVLDYIEKAAAVDPSLASRANNQAEPYKQAMPSAEDKFFKGWEAGDSFTIDGELGECYAWINETTRVR